MKKHELYQALYELMKVRREHSKNDEVDGLFALIVESGTQGTSATKMAKVSRYTPQETARFLRIWDAAGLIKRVGSGTEKSYIYDAANIDSFLNLMLSRFYGHKSIYAQMTCLRHEWLLSIVESVNYTPGQSRADLQSVCPEKSSAAFNDGLRRLIAAELICYEKKGYYINVYPPSVLEVLEVLAGFRNKYQTQAQAMLQTVNER